MVRAVQPRPARRRRLRQRFLLTGLGIVFAASAVLRLGSLDLAFANAPEATAAQGPSGGPDAQMPLGRSDLPVDMTAALQAALAEVDALRADLTRREAEIADRERAVATAQTLVEARLSELEAAEARLSDLIATSDSAAETDIDRLTRVYQTMPAEQAAALFERMEPSFAAGFLSRMTPVAGATLMAEMSAESAYAVSVVIATRNSSAPRLTAPPEPGPPDTQN